MPQKLRLIRKVFTRVYIEKIYLHLLSDIYYYSIVQDLIELSSAWALLGTCFGVERILI